MKVIMGPVLGFRGLTDGKWNVSALVVCEGQNAPSAACAGKPVPAQKLLSENGSTVWRFDMQVAVTAKEQAVGYAVAGVEYQFHVPAKNAQPTMAYTSCNGFSSPSEMKKVTDKNALWKVMAARHNGGCRYHLLMMGGDQVYADPVWDLSTIKTWVALTENKRRKASFTQAMHKQVNAFYYDLYCTRWSQPEVAAMLASIPTIMMWDDHDIFDGWGSYADEDQLCDVYRNIFAYARRYFKLFQQHLAPDEEAHAGMVKGQGHFSLAYYVNGLAIVAPDMRSERTRNQVLSGESWNALYRWVEETAQASECKHLVVMSSIPVVHPDFTSLEAVLCNIPGAGLEDDLRDHWHNRQHKGERLRLIQRLFALEQMFNTRVTIVSGDVHVAAIGALVSKQHGRDGEQAFIHQLTSSGVVHPAPSGMVLYALNFLCRNTEEVDTGITADMQPFPGTQNKFIGQRNFLSLEPDDLSRIWANWLVEGEAAPYTKVINPCTVQKGYAVRSLR